MERVSFSRRSSMLLPLGSARLWRTTRRARHRSTSLSGMRERKSQITALLLRNMHIPHASANSYWEGEWLFPATRTKVAIALPGGLDGPDIKARAFYLELSTQFDHVVKQVWPALDRVFREWIGRPLDTDLWKDVRLSGFGVEPLNIVPITWDVMFETTGEKWLAITVPFVGDSPQDPVVDT